MQDKSTEIVEPIKQLNLYGYNKYFDFFDKLYQKNKLPNSILLSGQKGLGKSTFLFHLVNYLLSENEKYKYDRINYLINENNQSYKFLTLGTHSNLFILSNSNGDNVKIDEVRKLLLFLNKSTYYKGIKIVIIDNGELLNTNSSNALLKSIEEPQENTYFFIINNDSKKILPTIKSRCVDIQLNLTSTEKKKIFTKIAKFYDLKYSESFLDSFLNYDSHGNLLKYLIALKNTDISSTDDYLLSISYYIDIYNKKNDPKILDFISLFFQNYYREKSIKNNSLIYSYHRNLSKILQLINEMKNFHLDKKNLIFSLNEIIRNER